MTMTATAHTTKCTKPQGAYCRIHNPRPVATVNPLRSRAAAASAASPLAEAKGLAANVLSRNASLAEVEGAIQTIASSLEFRKLTAMRDKAMQTRDEEEEKYGALRDQYSKALKTGGEFTEFDEFRQHGLAAHAAHFEGRDYKRQLEEWKNTIAPLAARAGELREEQARQDGTYVSYDETTLGDMQRAGDFPSGSREWLEARQFGVGGSDVGKILGADPRFAYENRREVWDSKVKPITDEQVESQSQGQDEFEDPASRGNAWEEYVGYRFAEAHPEFGLVSCKASWKHEEDEHHRVNFDFLLTRAGEDKPSGLLEIKTSSHPEAWGPESAGIDGIPAQYRHQVLWGALGAGFDHAAVGVVIDEHDYRYYSFPITDELREEALSDKERVGEFWADVEHFKETGQRLKGTGDRRYKGFPQDTITGSWMKDKLPQEKKVLARKIAVLRDEDPQTVHNRIRENLAAVGHEDEFSVSEALHAEVTGVDFRSQKDRVWVNCDLETSGVAPSRGSIIEYGSTTRDHTGKEAKKVSELYGLSEIEARNGGTGMEEVHHINLSDVAGKKPFHHPAVQKQVLADLTQPGAVMVAHNLTFEQGFLRLHLNGFLEAEYAGRIKGVDTMDLSRWTESGVTMNKLSDFCAANGVKYENAHRSYQDSNMMADALFRWNDRHDEHDDLLDNTLSLIKV